MERKEENVIRSLKDLERVDWKKVKAGGEIELPPEPEAPIAVAHLDLNTEFIAIDLSSSSRV